MSTLQSIDESRGRSTGPRTTEGKLRSSLNACRHGLTGQVVVMPGEDLEAFQRHCKQAFHDLAPVGFLEEQAVRDIANISWRLNRAHAHEANLLAIAFNANQSNFLVEHPEAEAALVSASAFQQCSRELEKNTLYEQRLNRHYHKATAELQQLQAARKAAEQAVLDEAALLKSGYDELESDYAHQNHLPLEPFQPSTYGFVLTNEQIQRQIHRVNYTQAAKRSLKGRLRLYNTAS